MRHLLYISYVDVVSLLSQ